MVKSSTKIISVFFSLLLVWGSQSVYSETIRVAVSSNFTAPMKTIIKEFEKQSAYRVKMSVGSSGKLYAQIVHGAPYDIFFSADQDKPLRLIQKGLANKVSLFTYAKGRLVLFSANPNETEVNERLQASGFTHLSIANPKLAPYGKAAVETLEKLGLNKVTGDRLLLAENISQAFQFVKTGNAELGFVSVAQLNLCELDNPNQAWLVPETMHQPILQDAVLISRDEQSEAAKVFISFVQHPDTKKILARYGVEP